MTPQERQLVSDLFDRLAQLESAPRDADAERVIAEGLRGAPNAIYPLVQTVLLQDEALRRADARLRELEGAPEQGGFLDSMRDALFGGRGNAATSVPSVRQGAGSDPRWGAPQQNAAPLPGNPPAQGGSFLGTAAASAVGVIGGAMMFNMLGSLFGGSSGSGGGHALASPSQNDRMPWDQSAAGSDLARDAGLGDIGRGETGGGDTRRAGLFDNGGNDDDTPQFDDFEDDISGDSGGDFGGE